MSRLGKQARWHKRVLAFERSGLTRGAWCVREGVATATLDYWRRRCRAVAEESGPTLIPIMVSDASAAVVAGAGPGMLEVDLGGGVCLRADAQVNAQWLACVLRGLR